jgi:hypothetical protein
VLEREKMMNTQIMVRKRLVTSTCADREFKLSMKNYRILSL